MLTSQKQLLSPQFSQTRPHLNDTIPFSMSLLESNLQHNGREEREVEATIVLRETGSRVRFIKE